MSGKILLAIAGLILILLVGSSIYNSRTKNFGKIATGDLCIEHANLKAHYHSEIEIYIDGEKQEIPSEIGISGSCMRAVHTHDGSGKIHVETPDSRNIYLKDFFESWGREFGKEKLFDKKADGGKSVKMYVSGVLNQEYENLLLKDGQKIVIKYE